MPKSTFLDNPLAIIGDEDAVLGFRAIGFKVYALKEPKDFLAALDEIIQQKIAVCLVQDNFYLAAEEEINSYKNLPFPIFIPFRKTLEADLLENILKGIHLRATGVF